MRSLLDTLAGTGPSTIIAENGTVERTTPLTPVPTTKPTIGNDEVDIMPYNATHDAQASDFLAFLWKRMQEDDLVDYYFPGQKETGFATFVRMMSGDAQVGLVLTKSPSDQWKDKVAGFISWTPLHLGHASIAIAGFIFFREFWDHHTTDAAGKMAFSYWFGLEGESKIDMVMGVCPSLHVMAIRYNKRIGLKEVGRLPGAHTFKGDPCDAILYAITRQQWEGRT